MPLFDQSAEKKRKENLRLLEDRRILFAEKLEKMNFRPERMLFCSNEDGSFTALARHNGKCAIITSPLLESGDDFTIDFLDSPKYERENILEKGTGLNGAFGFGTKGANGFVLSIYLDDGRIVKFSAIAGRTAWMESPLKRNPLLKTKRRRGDANVIWDLMPIFPDQPAKIEAMLDTYYFA